MPDEAVVRACSSAGGGLRLAVVGYERTVTAQAGHRVGLSAGAKVVHVAAGELTTADVAGVRAARPDIILLVGGTDGGNSNVLLHNAARLAKGAIGGHGAHAVPVVVAGNVDVRDEAAAVLATTNRPTVLADNVLPQIGVIAPESARAAIREPSCTTSSAARASRATPPSPRWSRRRRRTPCSAGSRCWRPHAVVGTSSSSTSAARRPTSTPA